MFCHVIHVHTETALPLVDDEGSVLEDSPDLLALVIEVVKGHEVSEEAVEVAEDVEELVHHVYVACLFCKSCILSHELEEGGLPVLGDELPDSVYAESLDCCACLCSLPCCVCGELCACSCPILFCEHILAGENCILKDVELCCPCRVYRCRKVDFGLSCDSRYWV